MTEVIVCTDGDSSDVNTWSNVPYFFCKALENKGVIVHRINIEATGILLIICKIGAKLKRIFRDKSCYGVKDFKWYRKIVQHKLKIAEKEYANSEYIITLDYRTVIPKVNGIKTVVFGDWTTAYFIHNHLGRTPNKIERKTLQSEKEAIESADYAITLFPKAYEYMKRIYCNANLHYIGNVINSSLFVDDIDEYYQKHLKGNAVLFIGRKNYIAGAVNLIKTVNKYNREHDDKISVNVVGLEDKDFDGSIDMHNVRCHGFLKKNNSEQKTEYYELIKNSKIIVNTTEKWSGASSIIEAMYFGCPVIVSPFEDFVATFGEKLNFGFYCQHNTVEDLYKLIEAVFTLSSEDFITMCKAAHKAVEPFTWTLYIERLIALLEENP